MDLTVIFAQRHAPKHRMPPAKETRAHLMTLEKNRMNKSVNGLGGMGMSPGKAEGFKMRRFKDVKSKISTNNIRVGAQRHAYMEGEDFANTNPVSEPIKKPEATPPIPDEDGQKQE